MATTLASGTRVFADANIFYLHFVGSDDAAANCTHLIDRALTGDVELWTTSHALSDAVHKVMCTEAVQTHGLPRARLVPALRADPTLVSKLKLFLDAAEELARLPLACAPVTPAVLANAARISVSHGLLSGDAIILAVMRQHQLDLIATADHDFDRINTITVWNPLRDIL